MNSSDTIVAWVIFSIVILFWGLELWWGVTAPVLLYYMAGLVTAIHHGFFGNKRWKNIVRDMAKDLWSECEWKYRWICPVFIFLGAVFWPMMYLDGDVGGE